MEPVRLLLHAYYEALYEILEGHREILTKRVKEVLDELTKDWVLQRQRYEGYLDACLAFVDERLELYNPIGIQYTFDWANSEVAQALEGQLDWFDASGEFHELCQTAKAMAQPQMSDKRLRELALELIRQKGAFPDKSIIEAYQKAPGLNKLPDYVVAVAIEGLLKEGIC